MMFKYTKTSK